VPSVKGASISGIVQTGWMVVNECDFPAVHPAAMAHVLNERCRMQSSARLAQFWERVHTVRGVRRLAFPGCWEFQGGRFSTGYGRILVRGRRTGAHRFVWESEFGEIPAGLSVLHKCDNRRCVHPDHLFLGTTRDNMRDMARKGRAKRNPSGEENFNARLSDADVNAIRERWNAADERRGLQTALAREYGVSTSTISLIVRDVLRPLAS
jgi:hypothetical protein